MSLLSRISRAGLVKPFGTLRSPRSWSSIAQDSERLTIDALSASFPFVWLRDSCLSPDCIHPSTSQKLHRTSDIPLDVKPAKGGVTLADGGLHIQWADGHKSFYPRDFLHRHSSSERLAAFHGDLMEQPWGAAEIARRWNLFVPYASLQEPAMLRIAIDQLCSDGLLFVTGVPTAETGAADCELRKLAGTFSHIRETFYGQVWDVVNVRDSRNIAYTNLDLGLHMDLLYFKNPPKYQILHCLRNRVHGGSSLFVDAFHAAAALDPAAFDVLSTTPLARGSRTIEQINYSPPFQAPLPLDTPPEFYRALAQFAGLLAEPARVFEYTLKEGDAVIFDNRRVLHARTAFSDKEGVEGEEGEPNRWLKGCYFEADALLDRGRMLRKDRKW
ncbi:hypothetical protein FB451DRAFT_1354541 [Mycena latifolia]|nr:hypothetical protein FB451DRAFT_1354541 [Mycena latifolia]